MKIKILPLILFLVVWVGLLRLGFWQLGRADEKRQLLAEQQQTLQQAEIDLVALLATTKHSRYQRVKLVGKYLPEQQFLIDNQILKQNDEINELFDQVINKTKLEKEIKEEEEKIRKNYSDKPKNSTLSSFFTAPTY